MAFEISVKSALAEAIVAKLLANATLAAYVANRIYRQEPSSEDDFLVAPCIFVWNDPPRDSVNPKVGGFAEPEYAVAILLADLTTKVPIVAGEISSTDRRQAIEIVLEAGDDGKGKLESPYAAGGASGKDLYLNSMAPTFREISSKDLPAAGVTLWPVIATYKTTVNRITRKR